MRPDSNLRQQFLSDGYVHIPQALGRDTLEAALACWQWSMANPGPASTRLFQDELWRAPGLAAARAIPNRETGFFYQDISNPQAFSVYEDVIRGTAICDLLKRLTTGEAWFVGEQVFLKEGSTPATGWHQDISDFPASGDNLFVLWIPFDPVDESTSLGLVQGSHRGPIYSSIYQSYKGKARPRPVEHVSFACEPGDIVVFHMGLCIGVRLHARTRPVARSPYGLLAMTFAFPRARERTIRATVNCFVIQPCDALSN